MVLSKEVQNGSVKGSTKGSFFKRSTKWFKLRKCKMVLSSNEQNAFIKQCTKRLSQGKDKRGSIKKKRRKVSSKSYVFTLVQKH